MSQYVWVPSVSVEIFKGIYPIVIYFRSGGQTDRLQTDMMLAWLKITIRNMSHMRAIQTKIIKL